MSITLPEYMSDDFCASMWQKINWPLCEKTLAEYQRELALAARAKSRERIKFWQKQIIRSNSVKSIAVRHVSESVAQSGIDGIKWVTDAEKMRAVYTLDPRGYMAQPMRLVIITPKGDTKARYVHIPTVYDRAMHTLFSYSLDPIAEATGDKKSFAFRRGRSLSDVHAQIMSVFNTPDPPMYILKTDVQSYYASIGHKWLLDNIPIHTEVLNEFLRAGHVHGGKLFPATDSGISLGSAISPILGNMVLDGAQQVIYDGLYGPFRNVDYTDGDLIRYADDMIITARTPERAQKIRDILSAFVAKRGLVLSEEKTVVINITAGFDFLARSYRYIDGAMVGKPSEAAIVKMEQKMRDLITPYQGGQKALIEKINKILSGWASYHKITEALPAFRYLDSVIKALLLELCEKLHPTMQRQRIIDRYFFCEEDGWHTYALYGKPDVRIHRLADTVLVRHRAGAVTKNPYIDTDYYEGRTDEKAIMAVTGKYKAIWRRQRGKCFYCGVPILKDQRKCIVPTHAGPGKSAYVHEHCALGQAEFYDAEVDISSRFDFAEFLAMMVNKRRTKDRFSALAEHLKQRKDFVISITFQEIEEILNRPLPKSAHKYQSYWSTRVEGSIGGAWRSNGYELRRVDREKCLIVLERKERLGELANLPEFLFERLPADAKTELELMFNFVKDKYGL